MAFLLSHSLQSFIPMLESPARHAGDAIQKKNTALPEWMRHFNPGLEKVIGLEICIRATHFVGLFDRKYENSRFENIHAYAMILMLIDLSCSGRVSRQLWRMCGAVLQFMMPVVS